MIFPFVKATFCTMAGADEEIQFETSEGVKVVNSFDDMGLKEDLVRGIYAYSKL